MKLSIPPAPTDLSLMPPGPNPLNRQLHNPPVAVPQSGIDSEHDEVIQTDYLLVCEAFSRSLDDGRWRFSLETAGGESVLEAEDREFGDLNRLTLLAAVRGLESLDGPSTVTLLSNNRYLIRSLSKSLPRWRQNNFRWEHFGRRIEVQHADLWRRIDRTLGIHRVQACLVSSCVVSHGDRSLAGTQSSDRQVQPEGQMPRVSRVPGFGPDCGRVDPPHSAGARPGAGVGRPAGAMGPAPTRRLQALLRGAEAAGTPPATPRRRGRFTAEDLASPDDRDSH